MSSHKSGCDTYIHTLDEVRQSNLLLRQHSIKCSPFLCFPSITNRKFSPIIPKQIDHLDTPRFANTKHRCLSPSPLCPCGLLRCVTSFFTPTTSIQRNSDNSNNKYFSPQINTRNIKSYSPRRIITTADSGVLHGISRRSCPCRTRKLLLVELRKPM